MTTPTVESIAVGLAKLHREVTRLKDEVAEVKKALTGFATKHPIPIAMLPWEERRNHFRTRAETTEPKSEIQEALYEFKEGDDLAIPTRTLNAIAKDLDGALVDIRAARLDINTISGEPDLRDAFNKWREGR